MILEFCVTRSTWERYHVANVRHTCYEQQQAFESQTESGVRACSVLTSIKIPPHILHRDIQLSDTSHQLVLVFFTHTTTDDFSNLREQYVCTLYSLTVCVLLHVECLDFLRIVNHYNRLLEVLFYQIAFVFAG